MALDDIQRMRGNYGPNRIVSRSEGIQHMSSAQAFLSVSDVERLAKAGVQMDYKSIAAIVVPDVPAASRNVTPYNCDHLVKPLLERLERAHVIQSEYEMVGNLHPEFISAVHRGDKMYVFYAPQGHAPVVIEDDANMYPSDALIAKFLLYKETEGKKQWPSEQTSIQTSAGVPNAAGRAMTRR